MSWDELPVRVATELTPWTEERRIAGVSSFGFGGTNAHVVVESPPVSDGATDAAVADGPVVVKVSGRVRTRSAHRHVNSPLSYGSRRLRGALREIAWAAGTGRADLPQRAAVMAASPTELADGLTRIAEGGPLPSGTVSGRRDETGAPRIAFLAPDRENTGVPPATWPTCTGGSTWCGRRSTRWAGPWA